MQPYMYICKIIIILKSFIIDDAWNSWKINMWTCIDYIYELFRDRFPPYRTSELPSSIKPVEIASFIVICFLRLFLNSVRTFPFSLSNSINFSRDSRFRFRSRQSNIWSSLWLMNKVRSRCFGGPRLLRRCIIECVWLSECCNRKQKKHDTFHIYRTRGLLYHTCV